MNEDNKTDDVVREEKQCFLSPSEWSAETLVIRNRGKRKTKQFVTQACTHHVHMEIPRVKQVAFWR